jgi:hypothetical protein
MTLARGTCIRRLLHNLLQPILPDGTTGIPTTLFRSGNLKISIGDLLFSPLSGLMTRHQLRVVPELDLPGLPRDCIREGAGRRPAELQGQQTDKGEGTDQENRCAHTPHGTVQLLKGCFLPRAGREKVRRITRFSAPRYP